MLLFISPKNKYFTTRFLEEAGKAGLEVGYKTIDDLALENFNIDISSYDTLYFRFPHPHLRQAIELGEKFLAQGKVVVDPSVLESKDDLGKWRVYQELRNAGLPIPQTWELDENLLANQKFPFIAKWIHGKKGNEVFLVKEDKKLQRLIRHFPKGELMAQEFIAAEFEYKSVVVGYRALPVILKVPMNVKNFKPDLHKAVRIQSSAIPQITSLAESGARATRRELSKMDILQKGDQLYILEVNRWPGLQAYEKLSGANAVKEFVQYVSKNEDCSLH